MRISVKKPAAVAAAALAFTVAAPGASGAAPLPGHAHRTVTAGQATFELDLLAAPVVLPADGGTVLVASEAGTGSVFTLRLPRTQEPATPAAGSG